MFDQLYVRPTALSRHLSAPLLKERTAYLEALAKGGWCRDVRRQQAATLLAIVDTLTLNDRVVRCVSVREIHQAAKRWAGRHVTNKQWTPGQCSQPLFISRAIRWLKFIGRLKQRSADTSRFDPLLAAFDDYMIRERGLSPGTQAPRRRFLASFLHHLNPNANSLAAVTAEAVEAAFSNFVHGYSRTSMRTVATWLRVFLHFAEANHWCREGLAAVIRGPRVYALATLPAGLSWDDVKRLLALTEGDGPQDIRDRAILMLLAIYGLRAGEVTRLRLNDIDWQAERLTICHSKSRKTRVFPLSQPVGDAILRYLTKVRPRSHYREVFLSVHAPIQPLRIIRHLVVRRLCRLNVVADHYGAHALRHACATHLLAQGLSLKQIGDHLGHACPDTTRIYAKVDLAGLRQVADLDLEGLL